MPCEGEAGRLVLPLVPGPAEIAARTLDLSSKLRRGTEIDRCHRIRSAYLLGRDCAGAYNLYLDGESYVQVLRFPGGHRARIFVLLCGAEGPFYTQSRRRFELALAASEALADPITPVGGGLESWTEFTIFCEGAGISDTNFKWSLLPFETSSS